MVLKVLVCGSRDWTDATTIRAQINALPPDAIVIQGDARGADKLAKGCAVQRGLFVASVPVESEHWDRHGRGAGHVRNHAMLELGPDRVIAFQRDGSRGTQGTIDEARRRGVPVEVHTA
jgi:YspA, cpYpsA-related SLOG family